jgi:hypothetical protein
MAAPEPDELVVGDRIRWEALTADDIEPLPESALVTTEGYVAFAMVVSDEGHYRLSWTCTINGDERTLPEVEDFTRRVATFINDEPVLPGLWSPGDEDP